MKLKFVPPVAVAFTCALAFALSACGNKEADTAENDPPPAGAQSNYGKMLEAAKNTAERANERSEKLKEVADPAE